MLSIVAQIVVLAILLALSVAATVAGFKLLKTPADSPAGCGETGAAMGCWTLGFFLFLAAVVGAGLSLFYRGPWL